MATKITEELWELICEAKRQVRLIASGDQVVVVKTAKSNIYYFANHVLFGQTEDEENFIQMLLNIADSEVKYVVCMWNDCNVEIPSFHFRKQLLAANPKNAKTVILLQTEPCLIYKDLKWTMPG